MYVLKLKQSCLGSCPRTQRQKNLPLRWLGLLAGIGFFFPPYAFDVQASAQASWNQQIKQMYQAKDYEAIEHLMKEVQEKEQTNLLSTDSHRYAYYAYKNLGSGKAGTEMQILLSLGVNMSLEELTYAQNILYNQKNWKGLELVSRHILHRQIDNAKNYNFLGLSYLVLGKIELANVAFLFAVEYNPKNIIYWKNLALTYARMKDWKNLKKTYQKILKINPDDAKTKELLASMEKKQTDKTKDKREKPKAQVESKDIQKGEQAPKVETNPEESQASNEFNAS